MTNDDAASEDSSEESQAAEARRAPSAEVYIQAPVAPPAGQGNMKMRPFGSFSSPEKERKISTAFSSPEKEKKISNVMRPRPSVGSVLSYVTGSREELTPEEPPVLPVVRLYLEKARDDNDSEDSSQAMEAARMWSSVAAVASEIEEYAEVRQPAQTGLACCSCCRRKRP